MKRAKVAIDTSLPHRLVRMLQTGFGDHGYEFLYVTEFASASSDDEFWASAFRRFGGSIVIAGDKNIARRPHQIEAFKENDLICFFCDKRWASCDGTYKVAHIVYWWPRIENQLQLSKPKDCWWVPMAIAAKEFRKVELPDHAKKKAAKRTAWAIHRNCP